MNNYKLNTKNWQRVRINTTSKVLTFTNGDTYKTKSLCERDIKSQQYIAINLDALEKFEAKGYTIVGNEVEKAIKAYAEAKARKEKARLDVINFLKPIQQESVKPFDYSAAYKRFYRKTKQQ